jgi:hypothetical protein
MDQTTKRNGEEMNAHEIFNKIANHGFDTVQEMNDLETGFRDAVIREAGTPVTIKQYKIGGKNDWRGYVTTIKKENGEDVDPGQYMLCQRSVNHEQG